MLPGVCKEARQFSSWQGGRKRFHTSNNTRGGTRTHNLLLRREAPYPLGHTSCAEMQLPLIQPRPSSSKSAAQPYWVSHSACTLLRATADANKMVDARKSLTKHQLKDTLPEWSKGVDSSSTSASCVGSNPTGVISHFTATSRSAPPKGVHCRLHPSLARNTCCCVSLENQDP